MPSGTITSTENTFGTVNGALSGTVAGTLTGSVGVPGPVGPQGPQGQQGQQGVPGAPGVGVPAGGTAGQFLTKTNSLDYATNWSTLSLDGYATEGWVTSQGYITNAALIPYLTISTASATYQTLAGMSAYLTAAAASSTYAVIAAGQPTSGTVGQVLTKNSGTNYDSSWQTLIPGDRYLTSSTTSLTINNDNKTLTVGTGLSYSSQQDVVISHDAANHMHARVLTYNSGTGVMTVDVLSHSGSGTFSSWTVNVGGAPALQSVFWGEILGVLGDQSDLAGALNSKLEVTDAASTYQTLSGMSAYLTTSAANSTFLTQSNAALTYQPLSGMTAYLAKSGNLSGLTDTSVARSNLGLGSLATVNDAPSDGSTYGRNNGAWVVAGGGGSFPADALTTNEVNAVANAEFTQFTDPATVSLTYGSGVLYFQDTQIGGDGKQITFSGGSSFSISNLGTSWAIGLMTDPFDPGYPKYVEDLVGFISSQGLSLTASWSGTTGTDTVDGLTTYTLTLDRPVVGIQSGDRLMIEQGLREYLTSNALSLSAAANSVLTYLGPDQNQIVSWAKPWQSEGYATTSFVAYNFASLWNNQTLGGKQTLTASNGSRAYLNLPHGTAPTTPVNGDIWTTTSGLFYRINGATVSPATLSGGTYTGLITTATSTTASAGLRLPHGTAPTTPVNGDIWTTTTGIFWRQNGSSQQAVDFGSTQTITGNKTFSSANLTLGNSTATGTIGLGTGATISASTKTIQIGTGGVSGSTTSITIGSTSGGASTTTVNGLLSTAASTTTTAGFRIAQGSAPTSPATGDIWLTSQRLFARVSSTTQGLATQADIGTSGNIATQLIQLASDSTGSGQTKTVNLGGGGVSGSSTSVNIGNNGAACNVNLRGRVSFEAPGSSTQTGSAIVISSGTPSYFAGGDIYYNSSSGVFGSINGFAACQMTAVRAFVNFSGTSTGTWAGGASTVTRTAGSTLATITTATAHGLVDGNVVRALTGVVAGTYVIASVTTNTFTITTVETTALSAVAITFAVNTIRASQNVSSIADNGAGDYTVNFSQSVFPDANYTAAITSSANAGGGSTNGLLASELLTNSTTLARTASAFRFITMNTSFANTDALSVNVVFFR